MHACNILLSNSSTHAKTESINFKLKLKEVNLVICKKLCAIYKFDQEYNWKSKRKWSYK